MVDLPWDLEWVESSLQEDLLGYHQYYPMGAGHGISGEHVERFSGVLPESVLYVWRRFGFDGFADGRFWITDPLVWAPVVDAWLEGTALPFPDQKWWCLNRTAMGDMKLWGEISGPALDVDPLGLDESASAAAVACQVSFHALGRALLTATYSVPGANAPFITEESHA